MVVQDVPTGPSSRRVGRAGAAVLVGGALAAVALGSAARSTARRAVAAMRGVRTDLGVIRRDVGAAAPLQGQVRELRERVDRLAARIDSVRTDTARDRRKELLDLSRQIESLFALYAELDLRHGLPSMRGFAISPDLAAHLLARVRRERPALVLEAGSGVSTLLLALALERLGEGRIIALEHEEAYAESTRTMLAEYEVLHRADVVHTPLRPFVVHDEERPWYDLDRVEIDRPIDLLLVDGPPQAIGPMSRLPAVPLLADRLADDAVVLLDDANRPDEQEVARLWCERDGLVIVERHPHERGTIELTPSSRRDTSP